AIAGRLFGKVVRGPNAARARHKLHRHGRFAGDVAADVAADESCVKIDPTARRAGPIDGHRPGDGVLRFSWLRPTQHKRSAGRPSPPKQRRDTVTLTQSRSAPLLRSRGEGEPARCAAITRHDSSAASDTTGRGHQTGIGISPTSFGTL